MKQDNLLIAKGHKDDIIVLAVKGVHAEQEFEHCGERFDIWCFYGETPKEPGLYVWEGEIEYYLLNQTDFIGAFRIATIEDIHLFGINLNAESIPKPQIPLEASLEISRLKKVEAQWKASPCYTGDYPGDS